MRLTLGWYLDGARHPATDSSGSAAMGSAVVGPLAFLSILERQVGLGRVRPTSAERISVYLSRMKAAIDGSSFYAASFEVDPWATAAKVLSWRDGLFAAGWDGIADGAPPRLADLAKIEAYEGASLPPSEGERVRTVLGALDGWPRPAVAELALVEPATLWPSHWKAVFAKLSGLGVPVLETPPTPGAASGDLAAFQTFLTNGRQACAAGDGSIAVLECDDGIVSAEAVGEWLAVGPSDGVVVVTGTGSALLDAEMSNRHLPRLGPPVASPWRTALQVLPLAFELQWEPFNARRAMELLALPNSPLSGATAGLLAKALSEEPGLGGERWNAAVAASLEARRRRLRETYPPVAASEIEAKVTGLEVRIADWLPKRRNPPREGMPARLAIEVAGRVAQWARARTGGDANPLMAAAARHAALLAEVIQRSGLDLLPRTLLGRMVDEVIGGGVADAEAAAQAAPWRTVEHPGQIWGPAEVVLWNGFHQVGSRGDPSPWLTDELGWLCSRGVTPDDQRLGRMREFAAARRAATMACRGLVLVKPRTVHGEAAGDHPLWASLAKAFEPERSWLRLVESATHARDAARSRLAGRQIEREEAEPLRLPAPIRAWALPPDPDRGGAHETVTRLETLLGCPLAYALSADGVLRNSGFLDLPDEQRMLGNLAHRVIQGLFDESRIWTPDDAANRARAIFDALAPTMASPLLEAGWEATRRASRDVVVRSVRRLIQMLRDAGLEVVSVETPVAREIPGTGVELRGKIDLVAAAPDDVRAIVDFKWRGAKTRNAQIRDGRAVQLVSYSWLSEKETHRRAEAGFFVLNKARLYFSADAPFAHAHVDGTDIGADWDRVMESWIALRGRVRAGEVEARGVDNGGAEEELPMRLDPPCRWCEFGGLCGAGGGTR